MDLGADMMRDQANDALAIGGDSRSPVSESPSESRSTQSRPSGLSITSTTRIFQKRAIAGPRACAAFAHREESLPISGELPPRRPRSLAGPRCAALDRGLVEEAEIMA
jgi:hypothetical protein